MTGSDVDAFTSSDEPIPTYEEALASSSNSNPLSNPERRRAGSSTSSIRQERTRRIFSFVSNSILPCFASHVSNLCSHVTIVIVPADSLPRSSTVTTQNIVSPSLQNHKTTGNVITLIGDENRPSFWTQQTSVQELDQIIRSELSQPASLVVEEPFERPTLGQEGKSATMPLPPFQVQPTPGAQLPRRPDRQSWLKRTFALPGEGHDPTGETGKWDLGWRSPTTTSVNQSSSWAPQPRTCTASDLQADEVAVHTQLRDVSFRTENEMGLLDTTTIKCIWIEIEVGV